MLLRKSHVIRQSRLEPLVGLAKTSLEDLRKRGVGLGHPHHEFGKVNTDALVDRRYPLGTFISS